MVLKFYSYAGYALLLLFCFALVASGYVLKEGLRKREKTTHELLLKCVIIITSVVPRELPMQMAMAVNMALMTLNKVNKVHKSVYFPPSVRRAYFQTYFVYSSVIR